MFLYIESNLITKFPNTFNKMNIRIIKPKYFLFLLVFLPVFILPSGNSDSTYYQQQTNQQFSSTFSTPWVDSVFNSLTIEQRIAQLLMIEVSSNQNRTYYNRIERIISTYNVGGLIFFKGGPASQLSITNHWQRQAQTPMLIAMDAEWGLAMRLDSTISFPRQITLGAVSTDQLIYELGLEMGRQARRMGVQITFSPVVDVNSNPSNPVINSRSFGECRFNVTRKGMALMHGIQDAGVIATAKHFPGHGDTDVDSHHALPLINHPFRTLDSVHLFPFRHLIDKGLKAVMVAHLDVPALGPAQNRPSSLSREVVTDLLQNQMNFKGLIITDALNMKGVTGSYKSGEVEVMALMAGNDILLMPESVPQAINAIKKAIDTGLIEEDYLNQKCRKILWYKEQAGLNNYRTLTLNNLINDLNSPRVQQINRRLAEAAITIVRNEADLLPLRRLDTLNIAALTIGSTEENPFQAMLANYAPIKMLSLPKNFSPQQARNITEQLLKHNLVIISIQNNSMFPGRNYGISQQVMDFVNSISATNNVVLNVFANPYSLSAFGRNLLKARSIMISYQDGRDFEEASAQVIFGAVAARGKLPVSVLPFYSIYAGINTQGRLRIEFGDAGFSGLLPVSLAQIDSIVMAGIRAGAFPGCQVAVIKDGSMIYNRSFGFHSWDNKERVKNSDIYDLASITKIVATTSAIMKLYDEGMVDIDKPLGQYMPFLAGSNKENLIIREIMAHQAQLRSWLPFHLSTLVDGKPGSNYYSTSPTDEFNLAVAQNLYARSSQRDSVLWAIRNSELLARKRYNYSDLGFILLAEMVANLKKKAYDEYLDENFFLPLGLQTMGFNPRKRFPLDRLIPTENDTIFRRQLIHGFVHDPAAALMGGVAGHAGLFSNASDLAVFMQMFLNGGSYGGVDYLKPETIKEFTATQFAGFQNRRALGFDKPTLSRADNNNPACESASFMSYGHTGFTGTYAWADPREDLVYVFLSNRVHPSDANRKITDMKIRLRVHQAIYDAIYAQRLASNRLK